MPLPFPHNDRPAVRGILHEDGRAAAGVTVRAAGFDNHDTTGPLSCEDYDAEAITDYRGEFEIRGDKDLFTIWWDAGVYGPNSLALCVAGAGDSAVWQTWFKRREFPPWLPGEVRLTCDLRAERTVLHCAVSSDEGT